MNKFITARIVIAIAMVATSASASAIEVIPPSSQNLVLAAPIRSWDEAIPLGNGLMGGLVWGAGNTIHVGLDRSDLWDERTYGPKEWWKTETWKKGGGMWEQAYHGPFPSKLPAGRIEITLANDQKVNSFELNYSTAEALAGFSSGGKLRAFISATEQVALIRIPGPPPANIEVLSPLEVSKRERGGSAEPDSHSVNALGYKDALAGSEGNAKWYVQTAAEGLQYCAYIESKRVGDETIVAVALTTSREATDLVALARERCDSALARGYETLLRTHVEWWKKFWEHSSITIPEPAFQNYYAFARYLYGAGSRPSAPPMSLQGVWTANNGSLPPWKGDYHSDLNTQMTYMAYFEAGDFDEGASYLNYLWNLAPVFRAFAKDFYGTGGLATPGVMSLAGQPLGGWGAYSLSPTMSAWNANLFYLHWLYTMDDDFLRTRAYPWCSDVGECMAGLLEPDKDGILKLLRSSSPEINGNCYLTPNTNYDLMCMKMLFLSLKEMADALGKPADAQRWTKLAAGLGDYHCAPDGELLLAANTPLRESHRHLSELIALYPFNLITCEGSALDKQRIAASLARPEWSNPTHFEWTGYTWAWLSCIYSRVGEPEAAVRHLDVFVKAYLSRNGFHVNQDQSRMGFGAGGGRPFTLEGNFLGLQAIQEMLLQSWSPEPGQLDTGIIRIFPATPWRWHDASFADLRAEGGHCVSARRENNGTTWFHIVVGRNGEIRVRDNFGGRVPKWNCTVTKSGDNFITIAKKGDIIEATLAKPAEIPPAPANLAQPVVLSEVTGIPANTRPLRIGADSNGNNCFLGDMARILVMGDRALTEEEIAKLANPENTAWNKIKDVTVVLDGTDNTKFSGEVNVLPADGLGGKMYRFNGKGFIEIPNSEALVAKHGLTLAAWIRIKREPPATGMRLFDKVTAGVTDGYLFDTYPKDSLRAPGGITFPAKLPIGQWIHVAATIDGKSGKQVLYINGKVVATNG